MMRRVLCSVGALAAVVSMACVAPIVSAAAVRPHTATYQYGFNTYVTYNCIGATLEDKWAKTQFAAFKALKANSVAIAFPLYTDSLTSNNIYAKDVCSDQAYQSPPPAILAGVVQAAHKAGLHVLLRPLLDETNLEAQNPAYWRGILSPSSVSTWFNNYLTTLRPYLMMAQSNKVEHFAIETELNSLAHQSNWTTAISLARALYTGDLVWNFSWNTPVVKFTQPHTTLGIDTYPALTGTKVSSTPAQLASKWTAELKKASYAVPNIGATTIDEVGIAAQNGAYAVPFESSLPLATHPFNQTIQANWFTAACTFMKQHHMRGIYYWGAWVGINAGALLKKPNSAYPTNLQPAAQAAIKKCF
jgi:hypothetical protein